MRCQVCPIGVRYFLWWGGRCCLGATRTFWFFKGHWVSKSSSILPRKLKIWAHEWGKPCSWFYRESPFRFKDPAELVSSRCDGNGYREDFLSWLSLEYFVNDMRLPTMEVMVDERWHLRGEVGECRRFRLRDKTLKPGNLRVIPNIDWSAIPN